MSVESLSVSVGLCRLTTVGLFVGLSGYCRATVGILCRSVEPGLNRWLVQEGVSRDELSAKGGYGGVESTIFQSPSL